jgi:hypothetical protein
VYYKGEGVTEADAKATGKFLEERSIFLKTIKKDPCKYPKLEAE